MKKSFTLLAILVVAAGLFGQETPFKFSVETNLGILNTTLRNPPADANYERGWQLSAAVSRHLKGRHHLRLGLHFSNFQLDFSPPPSSSPIIFCFECDIFWFQIETRGVRWGHQFDLARSPGIRLSLINALQTDYVAWVNFMDEPANVALSYAGEISADFKVFRKLWLKTGWIFQTALTRYADFHDRSYFPIAYGMNLGMRRNF